MIIGQDIRRDVAVESDGFRIEAFFGRPGGDLADRQQMEVIFRTRGNVRLDSFLVLVPGSEYRDWGRLSRLRHHTARILVAKISRFCDLNSSCELTDARARAKPNDKDVLCRSGANCAAETFQFRTAAVVRYLPLT